MMAASGHFCVTANDACGNVTEAPFVLLLVVCGLCPGVCGSAFSIWIPRRGTQGSGCPPSPPLATLVSLCLFVACDTSTYFGGALGDHGGPGPMRVSLFNIVLPRYLYLYTHTHTVFSRLSEWCLEFVCVRRGGSTGSALEHKDAPASDRGVHDLVDCNFSAFVTVCLSFIQRPPPPHHCADP